MNLKNIKVIPLGGLGEIGKNITAFEYDDEIIVIDCGIAFPDEDMYGIDTIIPDITYLLENKDKVQGIFVTHGHEDHIGAIPYILKDLNVPIYATKLTIGIIQNKLSYENTTLSYTLKCVNSGDIIQLKNFKVEFIQNTHSIADSCSIALHTPLGIILHTGDFKIDYTPIDGNLMDLERISTLARQGILLLMADSTNVERKGHSMSEKTIGDTLSNIFSTASGRIIVATFASNIHRIQQIINSSLKYGRKVAFSGKSVESISQVARELGYLHIDDDSIISIDNLHLYNKDQITIITTGSQGEPMAALSRIAYKSHRKIQIEKDDLFIISASPIPGNDKLISKVINEIFKQNAQVIYNDLQQVHVSGHAYQEELKLIHTLSKAKYFMPIHGEYRHLIHHSKLAQNLGTKKSNIFILNAGQILEISDTHAQINSSVKVGNVYIDGLGIGDVGSIVLKDRRNLAKDGIVIIVFGIERESKTIICGPDIISRGFIYMRESEKLISKIKIISQREINACLNKDILAWQELKIKVKKSVSKFLYEQTKRRPTIIPIIMEM